ncbi:hypothetical protein TNCV_1263921 [Trichonephila clavipes]|nr:hypothetical protein TNCV_1263921 [Trichonephila clavipes]
MIFLYHHKRTLYVSPIECLSINLLAFQWEEIVRQVLCNCIQCFKVKPIDVAQIWDDRPFERKQNSEEPQPSAQRGDSWNRGRGERSETSTGVRSGDRGSHVNLQRLLMILILGRPDLNRSSSDFVSSIAKQALLGVPLSKALFQSSHFSEVGTYAVQESLIPCSCEKQFPQQSFVFLT